MSSVHRLGEGGSLPWVPPALFSATAALFSRATEAGLVTAMVTAMGAVVHRPIFPERAGFGDLAGMVTATLGAVCHRRVRCPHANNSKGYNGSICLCGYK